MSSRTLVFVDRATDAGPPDPSVDIVVLDATWTPAPGGRADVIPVRASLHSVLQDVDLFDGSLAYLDAWAAAATLADRFMVDGVTWWFRVRMIIRWDVHELILWRHVIALVAPPGRYATMIVPADRTALIAAARACGALDGGLRIVASGRSTPRMHRLREWVRAHVGTRNRRRIRDAVDRVGQSPRRRRELARRTAVLDARVRALSVRPGGVVAVASAGFFQVTRTNGRDRLADPHLAPVLDRLAEDGCPVATIALALDHRRDAEWERIERDEQLLPDSMIRGGRWAAHEDDAIDSADIAARLVGVGDIPIDVAGVDLGPALGSIVAHHAGTWLDGQRRWSNWAERLLRELRPGVILVDHEGVRTLWLAAARRLGIPVVAVQHGVIFPNNPEYCHPSHPGLVRPEMTCVFGTYERDVLVEMGGYRPTQLTVTGSARADPDATLVPESPEERRDVRRDLGIAEDDRLLVVSVAHNPVGGDIHSVSMVARILDGPLPGVHVAFKLHPQDKAEGTYEATLAGLAGAGGYPTPHMSVVRDYDLYRLLRAADAHLGQYSTVLTDAVVAGAPNMIAVGTAYADMLGYAAARVAVPVRSVEDVRAFMADPRPPDPDDRERFLAAHFRSGDAVGRIAAALREAMSHRGPGQDT